MNTEPAAKSLDSQPLVSVIIVNFNGLRFLDTCLLSLKNQDYPREKTEVIVVDNGSHDESVLHLKEKHSWVRVVEAGKNLGFAGGNNLGFHHANGEFLVLLNNDTEVRATWLSELIKSANVSESIGMVSSKILFHHDHTLINSTGLCILHDGRGFDRGFQSRDQGQYDLPDETFGACGASVLLRSDMVQSLKGFDERLFMYYEDLDLAWRARLAGWKCVYCPTSIMHHIHCGSSGQGSPFFTFQVERNRALVSIRNAPPWMAIKVLAIFLTKAIVKITISLPASPISSSSRTTLCTYLKALGSFLLNAPAFLLSRFQDRPSLSRSFVLQWVRKSPKD